MFTKRILATCALIACALSAQAQAPASRPAAAPVPAAGAGTAVGSADAAINVLKDDQLGTVYEERALLIDQLRGRTQYSLGLYPGRLENSDLFFMMRRYLPLVNFLSDRSGHLISFVPLKQSSQVLSAASASSYDFIYTSAETAVPAVASGYRPLIKRNDAIQGVWLVRANSPIRSIDDLVGRKVGVIDKAMETTLSRFILIEKKIADKVNYLDASGAGQAGMVDALKTGIVDSIVLNKQDAARLIRDNANTFKVLAETGEVPGFILLAKKGTSEKIMGTMTNSFVNLRPTTLRQRDILNGFDAATGSSSAAAFSLATDEDLLYARRVVEAVRQANLKARSMANQVGAAPATTQLAAPTY